MTTSISACGGGSGEDTDLSGADAFAPDDVPEEPDQGVDEGPALDAVDGPDATDNSGAADAIDDSLESDIPDEDPDTGPGIEYPAERAAWVYLDNPTENNGQPTQVTLTHFSDPWGRLTGPYAEVSNCLNEPGGQRIEFDYNGMDAWIDLCRFAQTVTPGEDGTYLHVRPPQKMTDPNDAFSEVMMFYGINTMRDYYHDVHGLDTSERPIFALVNLQFAILGVEWYPLDNAAYVPAGSFDGIGIDLGVDRDMLAFGQGERLDFACEVDVIHHEYTHYVIGGNRLFSYLADEYGFNNFPLSMNEGFADYFPASLADNSVLGAWALGASSRDLSRFRKCPDHIVGEVHYDGEIWSSTLWHMRTELGREASDDIAFQAMMRAGPGTTLTEMSQLILEAVEDSYPQHIDAVEAILDTHGITECERVLPFPATPEASRTLILEGRQTSGIMEYRYAVPAPVQHRIEVPEATTSLTIRVDAKAAGMVGGAVAMSLSLRRGSEAITHTFFPQNGTDADIQVTGVNTTKNTFEFTVAGDCLEAGTYVVQFVNRSGDQVYLNKMAVDFGTEPFEGEPNYTSCVR
jgi:hypothetical protein